MSRIKIQTDYLDQNFFFFFFKYAERVLRIEKNTSVSSQMLPGH